MSEFIRIPYCILPEICSCNNGFAEGYLLGILSVFIVYSLFEIIETINLPCNIKKTETEIETEYQENPKKDD